MEINLKDIMQVNALKLSLCRTIDCVNHGFNAVFCKCPDDEVWENVDRLNMSIDKGMTTIAKNLYMEMMREGSVDRNVIMKNRRVAIAEKKSELLRSGNTECVQLLDVLYLVVKHSLIDRSVPSDNNASEITVYRKFAKILDEFLDNSIISLMVKECQRQPKSQHHI